MLFRKRSEDIKKWINEKEKTALLVSGARQTGKTFLIRECLKELKVSYVEFNFIERPDVVRLFSESKDLGAKDILVGLSFLSDKPMKEG